MKAAYFTESLPPLVDRVTHTLCNLVNTLEKDKIAYRFFAPVKPDSDVAWRDHVYKVASAPFLFYPYYRVGLPYLNGIDRQLDHIKPDVIHVVSPTLLGLYGIQYGISRKFPVVASYHTHFVSYFDYYGFSRMAQIGWSYLSWFHNKCRRTFTPSASAMRELQHNGVQQVELWPHGVDLEKQVLARWYALADMLVFPSTTETFGDVILEAFASGVPAVGVAQGGVGDLIMPGVNGLLDSFQIQADPIQVYLLRWLVFFILTCLPTPGAEAAFYMIFMNVILEQSMAISLMGWRYLTFYLPVALAAMLFLFTIKSRTKQSTQPIAALLDQA